MPDGRRRYYWTTKRKAEIVKAVIEGKTTAEKAMADNDISPEEFADWIKRWTSGGAKALRVTVRNL